MGITISTLLDINYTFEEIEKKDHMEEVGIRHCLNDEPQVKLLHPRFSLSCFVASEVDLVLLKIPTKVEEILLELRTHILYIYHINKYVVYYINSLK